MAFGYAMEHDLENNRWILTASRAVAYARRGDWGIALVDARLVLQRPTSSPLARFMALTTLCQILARRGDPESSIAFDDALSLAKRSEPVVGAGPVHAARAEAALLQGHQERARAEAEIARDLVFMDGNRWLRGELAWLLWRSGAPDVQNDGIAEPYALQIAGDASGAAAAWQALGCPYEEARALAESDDASEVHRAVSIFERLGARPAAVQAIAHLRTLGVRDLPPLRRGPQAATRAHPAGLTPREVEVLALLAGGLRNAEIAERLFLTPKTVGHHVSAILAKLGVETRHEAVQAAANLGILPA
jgi:DNA-binding CsgD family transcriptional regulator